VSLGFGRIEGEGGDYRGVDLWGARGCAVRQASFAGKANTILALGGRLYTWVHPGSGVDNLDSSLLYVSSDSGLTWTYAGSEFTLADDSLGLVTFVQAGRAHGDARDGFVYLYAAVIRERHWDVQKPGQLLLLRAPAHQLAVRSAYEYYGGLDAAGRPLWGPAGQRRAAFLDPNGLMRSSAVYNADLDRYLLVTNHAANNQGNPAVSDAPSRGDRGPRSCTRTAGPEPSRTCRIARFSRTSRPSGRHTEGDGSCSSSPARN
jgi:hypothetical protein